MRAEPSGGVVSPLSWAGLMKMVVDFQVSRIEDLVVKLKQQRQPLIYWKNMGGLK